MHSVLLVDAVQVLCKYFTCINYFNPHNSPQNVDTIISPNLYR